MYLTIAIQVYFYKLFLFFLCHKVETIIEYFILVVCKTILDKYFFNFIYTVKMI
jgi:hypothetical protein